MLQNVVAAAGGRPPSGLPFDLLLLQWGGVTPGSARNLLLLHGGVDPPHCQKPCCCYRGHITDTKVSNSATILWYWGRWCGFTRWSQGGREYSVWKRMSWAPRLAAAVAAAGVG